MSKDAIGIKSNSFFKNPGLWLIPLLLGIAFPLITEGLIPLMGLPPIVQKLLSPESFFFLLIGLIALLLYDLYFKKITHISPILLIYGGIIIWPLFYILDSQLQLNTGVNLHIRLIVYILLSVPCAIYVWKNHQQIFAIAPFYKFLTVYVLALIFYYFFFNLNTTDNFGTASDGLTDSSLAAPILFYNFSSFVICGSAVIALGTHPNPREALDRLNFWFMLFSAVIALITIIGYPFGLFVMNIDGFNRLAGFFSHPNPNAYHYGVILTYMICMFFYYQGERKRRLPIAFLPITFSIIFIAFIMALSKGAMGALIAAASIFFIVNLVNPLFRRRAVWFLLGIVLVGIVGVLAYQSVTGDSFVELIQRRLENTNSLEWREKMWDYLLSGINLQNIWHGHGLTAGNALYLTVSSLTYSQNNVDYGKPVIYIHNAYYQLLYDMGLVGMTFFMTMLGAMWKGVSDFFKYSSSSIRALTAGLISMSIYVLIMCGIDEVIGGFDALTIYFTCMGIFSAMIYYEVKRMKAA